MKRILIGLGILLPQFIGAQAPLTICTSGCDYATIQACVNDASPGDTCQVQANTVGGSITWEENVTINNVDGTLANPITLQARAGDTVVWNCATGSGEILDITESEYWIVEGFAALGVNTWSGPTDTWPNDSYACQYGFRVHNNSNHIILRDMGTPEDDDAYAVWGSNNYFANEIGAFDDADGVEYVMLDDMHFQLAGSNNAANPGSGDWGNLVTISAPYTVATRSTFLQGGHNPVEVQAGPHIFDRNITDNDWRSLDTGEDGYRSAAFVADKSEVARIATGDFLVRNSILRHGLDGVSPNPVAKFQSYRGVYRFVGLIEGDYWAILANRNNGDDGDVTEQKISFLTVYETESFWRTVETDDTLTDMHFEHSVVNACLQNLGAGDNLDPDTYIYLQDESDRGAYANGWKGSEFRGITVRIDNLNQFEIALNDDTGGWQRKTIAQSILDWPANFSNWDIAFLTFADMNAATTSWDFDTAFAGMEVTGDPFSASDVEPVTTMVGAGSNATSGTFADGRWFVLPETHWGFDASFFGDVVEDDYVWIGNSRVQLTSLNKDTGAATWTPAISWANGEDVLPDYYGTKPTIRCAHQPTQSLVTGPGVPASPHL